MKLYMFSIFDSKACAYLQPFFSVNAQVAMRAFQGACRDPGHDFGRFPADYTLMSLGEWDQTTGVVTMFEVQGNLGNGVQFQAAGLVGEEG